MRCAQHVCYAHQSTIVTGMRIAGNEFNKSELAGAFGDLGTLIPFVVGYITVTASTRRASSWASGSSRSLPACTSAHRCRCSL